MAATPGKAWQWQAGRFRNGEHVNNVIYRLVETMLPSHSSPPSTPNTYYSSGSCSVATVACSGGKVFGFGFDHF